MSFRASASPATPPKRKHDPDPRYVPSSQHSHIMSSPTVDPSLPNAGLSPYHHHHRHNLHHPIVVDRRHVASASPSSFVGTSKVAQLEHTGPYQWVDQTLETSVVNGRERSDLSVNPALLVSSPHLGTPQKRSYATLDHVATDSTPLGGYLKKRRHDGLYDTVVPLKKENRYPPGNSQDEIIIIGSSDEEYNGYQELDEEWDDDEDEGEGDEDDDGEEEEEAEEEEGGGREEEEEEESYVPPFRQGRASRDSRRRKALPQSASSRVLEGWKSVRDANDHRWAGKKAARDSTSGNGSGSGSTVSLSPASFRSPKSVAGSGQIDRGSFQTPSNMQYGSEGAKPIPVPPKGSATATSRSTPVVKKDYHQYTHHDHLHPVLKASPSNPLHTSLSPIGSSSRKEKIAATKGGHARHAKPSSPSQHPRTFSSAPASGPATTGKGKGKAPTTAAPVRLPHSSTKSPLRVGATSRQTAEPFKRAARKPTSQASKPTSLASKPTSLASKPTSLARKPTSLSRKPTSLARKPTSLARKPTSLTRKPAPASEAATFAFSTKASITATVTTSTSSTRPTRSAAAMSAFVAAGSFDTLITSKTQRAAVPKKGPPPMTLFSYMATLDLAKNMPDPRRGWPRPRRTRRDGTDGFDILSIVPDHVVPCLQGGRLAYRDASVSASGRVKRGRVYPLYPEKLV